MNMNVKNITYCSDCHVKHDHLISAELCVKRSEGAIPRESCRCKGKENVSLRRYGNTKLSRVHSKSIFFTYAKLCCDVKGKKKGKAVPLHAMEAFGGRGDIAPTHSRPRH
jgi:hypothetical protein